ncbi:uncharacterized protein TNIN_29721 [Trichonephila inaurata madagascariensis]|uniref:Uncharacterized protein n=1 Tax=Trichonephila inaurata madagascariensis TaxID=2747483 RepID=A0A8X7CME1_9ARAC|nr:uncharacterized protein TNIN_29721 [Trichonephila inaurata madagascariensis]
MLMPDVLRHRSYVRSPLRGSDLPHCFSWPSYQDGGHHRPRWGAPNLGCFLLAGPTANEEGVILGILVSLTLATYLSFVPNSKPYPFLPFSNECPSLRIEETNFTTHSNLPFSSAIFYSNTTVVSTSRPESENVSFNLSYMWISTLAFVSCLIVGYFGSWIISCCRGKPNEVPEIYLSPIRIKFPKKCTTAKEEKGKTKASNVGISKQACEISTINFTDKSQTETHL